MVVVNQMTSNKKGEGGGGGGESTSEPLTVHIPPVKLPAQATSGEGAQTTGLSTDLPPPVGNRGRLSWKSRVSPKAMKTRLRKAMAVMDPWVHIICNRVAMFAMALTIALATIFLIFAAFRVPHSFREIHGIVRGNEVFRSRARTGVIADGRKPNDLWKILPTGDPCVYKRNLHGKKGRRILHDLRHRWSAIVDKDQDQCLLVYMEHRRTCRKWYPFDLDGRLGLLRPQDSRDKSMKVYRQVSKYPVRNLNCAGPQVMRECRSRPSYVVYDTVVKYSSVGEPLPFRIGRESLQAKSSKRLKDTRHREAIQGAAKEVESTLQQLFTTVKDALNKVNFVMKSGNIDVLKTIISNTKDETSKGDGEVTKKPPENCTSDRMDTVPSESAAEGHSGRVNLDVSKLLGIVPIVPVFEKSKDLTQTLKTLIGTPFLKDKFNANTLNILSTLGELLQRDEVALNIIGKLMNASTMSTIVLIFQEEMKKEPEITMQFLEVIKKVLSKVNWSLKRANWDNPDKVMNDLIPLFVTFFQEEVGNTGEPQKIKDLAHTLYRKVSPVIEIYMDNTLHSAKKTDEDKKKLLPHPPREVPYIQNLASALWDIHNIPQRWIVEMADGTSVEVNEP